MTAKTRAARKQQIPKHIFTIARKWDGDGMAQVIHEFIEGDFEIDEMYRRIIGYLTGHFDW